MSETTPNDVNVLRDLLDRVKAGQLPALAKAYVKAWGEVGSVVVKNANNPHFKNDYADLSAVLAVLKPVFAANELALIQVPGKIVDGKISVVGVLMHSSGEQMAFETQLPIGDKQTAQAAGSAITYGRRYQAGAIAGIAPADDDGEAASAAPPVKKAASPKVDVRSDAPATGVGPESPNDSYAQKKLKLVNGISEFSGTHEECAASFRPLVDEMGDEDVNKVYVAKRKELKGKK